MSNTGENALLMRVKQSELPKELIENLYCRILQEGASDVVACTIENALANEGLLRRIGESELSREQKDMLFDKIIAETPRGNEVCPDKSAIVLRVLESRLSRNYKGMLCCAIICEEDAYDAVNLFTTLDLLCKVAESHLSKELKEVLRKKIVKEGPVEEVVRVVKYSFAKGDGGEDASISISTLQHILHSRIKSVLGLVHETRYFQAVDTKEAVLSQLLDSVLDDLIQCLKAQAFTLGANAIVNFRTSISVVPVSYSTGGGAMGITSYTVHVLYGATVSADGMAVFVEPDS